MAVIYLVNKDRCMYVWKFNLRGPKLPCNQNYYNYGCASLESYVTAHFEKWLTLKKNYFQNALIWDLVNELWIFFQWVDIVDVNALLKKNVQCLVEIIDAFIYNK